MSSWIYKYNFTLNLTHYYIHFEFWIHKEINIKIENRPFLSSLSYSIVWQNYLILTERSTQIVTKTLALIQSESQFHLFPKNMGTIIRLSKSKTPIPVPRTSFPSTTSSSVNWHRKSISWFQDHRLRFFETNRCW